jgi:hypothetical protein
MKEYLLLHTKFVANVQKFHREYGVTSRVQQEVEDYLKTEVRIKEQEEEIELLKQQDKKSEMQSNLVKWEETVDALIEKYNELTVALKIANAELKKTTCRKSKQSSRGLQWVEHPPQHAVRVQRDTPKIKAKTIVISCCNMRCKMRDWDPPTIAVVLLHVVTFSTFALVSLNINTITTVHKAAKMMAESIAGEVCTIWNENSNNETPHH